MIATATTLVVLVAAAGLLATRPDAATPARLTWLVAVAGTTGILGSVELARTGAHTWSGPAGVTVVVDGFAALMVATVTVVAVAVAASAIVEDRCDPGARHPRHWLLLLLVWAALSALPLSGDLITSYLLLEVAGLCGAVLVTHGDDRGALLAGTRYLLAEMLASLTLLAGIGLLWSATGTVRFDELAPALDEASGLVVGGGVAMVVVGLLLKLPLAPLHLWLPAAHSVAPRAVSPLLSGVMVKAAFVVLARLWMLGEPTQTGSRVGVLLGAMGAVAIVWGSVSAWRSADVKRLIAASTAAQLGLLMVAAPLVVRGDEDAWVGTGMLAVSHAPAKAAMLLAAACMVDSARRTKARVGARSRSTAGGEDGSEQVRAGVGLLEGSAARRPVALVAFAIGGLSLVGLPPTGGFVAKWSLLLAGITEGTWWLVVMLLVATALTTTYLLRCLVPAFAADDGPPGTIDVDARDVIALLLALTVVVMGLAPMPLIDLLVGS